MGFAHKRQVLMAWHDNRALLPPDILFLSTKGKVVTHTEIN